jgi:hypothetical protein
MPFESTPPSQSNTAEAKQNTYLPGSSANEEANMQDFVKKLMENISNALEMKEQANYEDGESGVAYLNELLIDHTTLHNIFSKIIAPEFVKDIRDAPWYDLCPMSELNQSSAEHKKQPEKSKIYVETGNDGRLSYLNYRMLNPNGSDVTGHIGGNEFPINDLKGSSLINDLKSKETEFLRILVNKGHAPSPCYFLEHEKKQEKFMRFCKDLASTVNMPGIPINGALFAGEISTSLMRTSSAWCKNKSELFNSMTTANALVKRYAEIVGGEIYQNQICALAVGTLYVFLIKKLKETFRYKNENMLQIVNDKEVLLNILSAYAIACKKLGNDTDKKMHALALIMIFNLHPIIDKILLENSKAEKLDKLHLYLCLDGKNAEWVRHMMTYCLWLNKNLPHNQQINVSFGGRFNPVGNNYTGWTAPLAFPNDEDIARYRYFFAQRVIRYQTNTEATNTTQSSNSQSQFAQNNTSIVTFSVFKPNLDVINNLVQPVASVPIKSAEKEEQPGCCCVLM